MKKFRESIALNKMAYGRAILYSIVSLGMAWQLAVNGEEIATYKFWDWINVIVGITVIWGNNMMSFLDKTMSRLSEGKSPFETGQTEFLTKQKENG